MFSLKRFVLNCRCQTGIKTKSSVQVLFFEKQVKMQLLNSNIPRRARTTRYGNKKAQDLLNLVLFMFCSFFVLQRWLPRQEGRRQAPLVTFVTANLRHAQVAIINCSPLWLQTVHRTVCLTRRAVYSLVIASQTHLLTRYLML